jgi:hypothetical protein
MTGFTRKNPSSYDFAVVRALWVICLCGRSDYGSYAVTIAPKDAGPGINEGTMKKLKFVIFLTTILDQTRILACSCAPGTKEHEAYLISLRKNKNYDDNGNTYIAKSSFSTSILNDAEPSGNQGAPQPSNDRQTNPGLDNNFFK